MRGVFHRHCFSLLALVGKEAIAQDFENLIDEMHSVNHDLPSRDGVFKGDGMNKDPRVTRAARMLDETADDIEKKEAAKTAPEAKP